MMAMNPMDGTGGPPHPNRRMYARHVCRLNFTTLNTGGGAMSGTVLNIGMGGAYVRILGSLKVTRLTLNIALDKKILPVEARVVRSAGVDPSASNLTLYGLEFDKDMATQQTLRVILDYVRVRSNLGGPRTMSGYWTPPPKPR